jgi:hypothetical protein
VPVVARTIHLLAIPVFGLMFGVLFIGAGISRLRDARRAAAEGRTALPHALWAAVGIAGGLAISYACVRVLIRAVLSAPP